ncbi:hypothetical protein [Pseudomonas sp. PS02290]|jgi:hypothetical protein|uniref:hypothetical protein n=1 Tax=Pseudomonas sp. PS02290 TaxID=2991430 RepID=UPI00249C71EB|nr:hypothetical protein [Pseudomonas sp. PS02290]
MTMTPERVAIRVELLIEAIRGGMSDAFAEHNAALTIEYIEQVYQTGIISGAQFDGLVIAVNDAADSWQPKVDADGLPLES